MNGRDLLHTLGTTEQDNLIAGVKFPIAHRGVLLSAGQGEVKRGTVLGTIKTSGESVPVDSTKSDGSQNPDCILAETIDTGSDTSAEAISAAAYSAGYFIRGSLIFGGNDTYETHELEMRKLNMHLSSSVNTKGAVN